MITAALHATSRHSCARKHDKEPKDSKEDFELDDGGIILLGEMKIKIVSFLVHLSVQYPVNVIRSGLLTKGT
ncbi:hypothetical protein GW7_13999 [Heterocephalus glaber]|uniref:Uncharacterized protein n=1 Tax=Heterocephalus glaber TaxID=10181 RepID=G5BKJ6_HETGA|nr:hypothetical protein GW7_13999 [Heterocephalus glaber]